LGGQLRVARPLWGSLLVPWFAGARIRRLCVGGGVAHGGIFRGLRSAPRVGGPTLGRKKNCAKKLPESPKTSLEKKMCAVPT